MNEVPVVEPTTNAFCPDRALIDSLANGDVVEKPTEPVNWLVFENVLKSASSVVEAVLSVPVIVTGAPPSTVKPEHDTEPEQVAEVVAVVLSSPVEPTYVKPCDRDVSLRLDENVDDAAENRPLVNPNTELVEMP